MTEESKVMEVVVKYQGRESSVCARSYDELEAAVKERTALKFVKLVHKGRMLRREDDDVAMLPPWVMVVGTTDTDASAVARGLEEFETQLKRSRERDVVNDLDDDDVSTDDASEEDDEVVVGAALSDVDAVTGLETGFGRLETLPQFADGTASKTLSRLARDAGVRAVMKSRKWFVPVLAEMAPDGKVGVDPVCVLGLNENRGARILLRLRTDDLRGFRKLSSLKQVLYHELAHNERSQHDAVFYSLVSAVQRHAQAAALALKGRRLGGQQQPQRRRRQRVRRTPPHRLGGTPMEIDEDESVRSRVLRAAEGRVVESSTTNDDVSTPPETTPEEDEPPLSEGEREKKAQKTDLTSSPAAPKVVVQEDDDAMVLEALGVETDSRQAKILRAARDLAAAADAASRAEAATTLLIILTNASLPDDKFKRIKLANRRFLRTAGKFPQTHRFLEAVGFERHDEALVLRRDDPALLWFGRSAIQDIVAAAS